MDQGPFFSGNGNSAPSQSSSNIAGDGYDSDGSYFVPPEQQYPYGSLEIIAPHMKRRMSALAEAEEIPVLKVDLGDVRRTTQQTIWFLRRTCCWDHEIPTNG